MLSIGLGTITAREENKKLKNFPSGSGCQFLFTVKTQSVHVKTKASTAITEQDYGRIIKITPFFCGKQATHVPNPQVLPSSKVDNFFLDSITTKLLEPVLLTRDMTSITHCNWSIGVHKPHHVGRFIKGSIFSNAQFLSGISSNSLSTSSYHFIARKGRPVFSSVVDDGNDPDDSEDDLSEKNTSQGESGGVDNELIRQNLERIVGSDDSTFSGMDLATLIRNKYGRSYDVQLIKKEFMGRSLLALNVMWKYREQRSFPLTEEEYLLRLDDVANTLKCWGAVSHIRNSLAKVKERPRIGKAVSIFIDMDESGGRANEWIYK